MARLIRRHSMERLELYDLDKLITIQPINDQLPPPLPPPRQPHYHRRPSINPTLERYQFLCNMTRNKTDPVYAATPMFTTIPQSSKEKPHRQLLGCYIRLENVKPICVTSPTSPTSPEPKKVQVVKDIEEEKGKENEDENDSSVEKEENNDDEDHSSGSSSDEQENAEGDILNDDKDDKGIVEQIFNRDKKD
jgi:hypothetical protein